ncbi:MAG: Gfo/Idh/MocA family oxidoreductase [Acidimicrobiales bacterium]|nr:Gfo/Idh/MocA family oxidoreductase [Acidimicrobiales bacterium]
MSRVVLQDLSDGATRLVDAPAPGASRSGLVIATQVSVVSAGTERMLVDFGRANLVGKARSQPHRVIEVVDKARTDGVATTVNAVRSKLTQPLPLGYSSAGMVVEVGADVSGVSVGDLVATAGGHAELAGIPVNLTAPVPEGVSVQDAAFATIGSIALQGLRLANPTVGERFAVVGLGLVGLIAVQLLQAQGCQVLGIDPNGERRKLAGSFGATTVDARHDVVAAADEFTQGRGIDGVIICASTTSNDPVHQAAQMSRQRGRIILVGVTGLELQRADFYEKELTFQVSASYGPGRYDASYEEGGNDYPFGLVRWTASRNMEAVLGLIQQGKLDVASLVTHDYAFDSAPAAYDTLVGDPSALGIVLTYPEVTPESVAGSPLLSRNITLPAPRTRPGRGQVGVLGAGAFASGVLLPAVIDGGGIVRTVVSSGGTSASLAAAKFGAGRASSDVSEVFDDDSIDTVVIATRHDSHARYVDRALRSGKHVFVEKPLAVTEEDLVLIRSTVQELSDSGSPVPLLMVGFNRRFSPVTQRMVELLSTQTGPKAVVLTMNAGFIPADHWTQDRLAGGGRLIGEACHFIDLARYLVGSPVESVQSTFMDRRGSDHPTDTAMISLGFADGSVATVNYLANGSKKFPKERIEVFSGGRVLVNDNFRTLKAYGWPGVRSMRLRSQVKGHAAGVAAFLEAVRSGAGSPIPLDELLEVSEVTLRAAEG